MPIADFQTVMTPVIEFSETDSILDVAKLVNDFAIIFNAKYTQQN